MDPGSPVKLEGKTIQHEMNGALVSSMSPDQSSRKQLGEGSKMGYRAILLGELKPLVYLAPPITSQVLRRIFERHNRRSRRGIKVTPQLVEALCEYMNQFRVLPSRIMSSYEAAEKAGIPRSNLFYYLGILKEQGLYIPRRNHTLYGFRYANICLRCRMRYPKDVNLCPICGKATRKRPRHLR